MIGGNYCYEDNKRFRRNEKQNNDYIWKSIWFLFATLEHYYIAKIDGINRIKAELNNWDKEAQKVIVNKLVDIISENRIVIFDENEILSLVESWNNSFMYYNNDNRGKNMQPFLFKKEIIINILVLLTGILLNIVAIFIDKGINNAISIILVSIGCSLIASSFVSFMSFLFSERILEINEQAKKIGLQSIGENVENFFVKKINSAKFQIDIVNGYGGFPVCLFENNKDIFLKLVSKGIEINILVYENPMQGYEKELMGLETKNRLVKIIEKLKKNGSIYLFCTYKNIGCEWIRIDDTIYQFVYNSVKPERKIVYEFKKIDKEDSPYNVLYNNYLHVRNSAEKIIWLKLADDKIRFLFDIIMEINKFLKII